METGVTKLKQTYTHIHIHVIFTKQYIHTHRIRKRKTNPITRKCQHFPLEVAWDNLFTLASASVISDFNISAPLISDFYFKCHAILPRFVIANNIFKFEITGTTNQEC